MDYLSCGWPDLSYHGEQPWRVDDSYNSRSFSFLYYGNYGNKGDSDIYVACNMNWDSRQFAIPYIDKRKKWKVFYTTDKDSQLETAERMITVSPRTVCILVSEKTKE